MKTNILSSMASLFAAMLLGTSLFAATPADPETNPRDAAAAAAARRTVITAAGATFPLPFYSEAFKRYWEKNDIPVTYAGIGTDRGIKSFRSRQIDFAGVDVPLTAAELKEMPAQTVLVPTSLGAVEIAYHLDGVDNLRLTGELVADIYLGRVTKPRRIASRQGNLPGVPARRQRHDLRLYPLPLLRQPGMGGIRRHG